MSNKTTSLQEYREKPDKINYNWAQIETDYISNPNETYENLQRKYGPCLQTISAHAIQNNWKQKRREYQQKKLVNIQERLTDKNARLEADEIAKMNDAHFKTQQGLKYLADKKIVEDVKRVETGQSGQLSVRQIQSLANANKVIQESQRLAKGLSEKELNLTLVTRQLSPLIEKIVGIIQAHATPEITEAIIYEFRELFGEDGH